MAFTRIVGVSLTPAVQRASYPVCNSFLRMSSNGFPPQPFKIGLGSSRRYTFGVVGGLLTCCGLGFAFRSYTSESFGFANQFKWIQEKIGWEKRKDMFQKANLMVNISGSENRSRACCEAKDECAPKCDDKDKEDGMSAKSNAELEDALKDIKSRALESTEAALQAYRDATKLIELFMDRAYCAAEQDTMESPQFEEVWCDVYETALNRCEKVKDAMSKGQSAWDLLCRLREVIENGKSCKSTECNPLLISAEEALVCAERELLNAKARVDCIQSESRLVEQYRNLVEDFRRDLKAEVESMMTGNPECKSTFTDNECAMILTHAYKKVLRVQKERFQVQGNGDCMPTPQC